MKYVALVGIIAVLGLVGNALWQGLGRSESLTKVSCGDFSLELVRHDVSLHGVIQSSFKVYFETPEMFSSRRVVDVAFLGEGESAQFALLKSEGARKEDAIRYHGDVLDNFSAEEYSFIYECVEKNPNLIKLR